MPVQFARLTPMGHAFWSTNASTAKSFTSTATSGSNLSSIVSNFQQVSKVYLTADTAIRLYLDGTSPNQNEGTPVAANTLFVIDTDPRKVSWITQGAVGNVYAEFVGA